MLLKFVDSIGEIAIEYCHNMGLAGIFLYETLISFFTTKLKINKVVYQINHIGVNSLSVVALTGACVGGILAYHTYSALHRFNGEQFISPIVFISMVREFGPVLSSIMVAGRAGSAMTAEIGTMKITEQIDALQTLCINVSQYLMIPRIVATTFIMPFLSMFCSLFGILAGYIVSIYLLNVNSEMYMRMIKQHTEMFDITSGLIKAACFGFILSWIATYKGYTTEGGAKGVGLSTTQSVVYACLSIFIADYILTALMF
ncbi:TPA: ABC transporter permease [Candidatus Dependentiae bacterium]|nr:MAG: hypothetical protein UR14_C0008G0021 [candidate division TM6 bacterium GW2011_GWE2_31_21]KKP53253.1 MAG: hypothetical protein UR43_C0006G0036 [candidate division TM6 bacterium GW2011_GWF2_33_332]HBS48048.1 ABC transporter permease [Candidatus Dependentiae bacterium]HBZ73349.1 ABC transporter permease [Candidatus Dependentiae bacterium]